MESSTECGNHETRTTFLVQFLVFYGSHHRKHETPGCNLHQGRFTLFSTVSRRYGIQWTPNKYKLNRYVEWMKVCLQHLISFCIFVLRLPAQVVLCQEALTTFLWNTPFLLNFTYYSLQNFRISLLSSPCINHIILGTVICFFMPKSPCPQGGDDS